VSPTDSVRTLVQCDEQTEWLRGATSLTDGPDELWGPGGYSATRAARSVFKWAGVAPVLLALGLATTLPPLDMSEVATVTNQVVQQSRQQLESPSPEDMIVVMPPKSITTIRMRIEYVRKATPLVVEPTDY